MKKIYLLFVAATLAACSAEPVENEFSGLDANLQGKKMQTTESIVPMGFYAGGSENLKGTLQIWNDCDNLYVEINPTGDAPEEVEISFVNALPELNKGGQIENLNIDYTIGDSENLLWTIPVSEFDTENDLLIFVKAWGDYAGSSTFGERNHQFSNFTFDFSLCTCEESFSYTPNENGTYTFTYVPEEDIDNAVLTFTFPQSVIILGLDGWTPSGNGNSQTYKVTMDLVECTSYPWTLFLDADCNPSGKTILFSDFKVGEDSKKELFEMGNIIKYCN